MRELLQSFEFGTLAHPWALLLLIPVALLALFEAFSGAPGAVTISTGSSLARLGVRVSRAWRAVPALIRFAGLSLLVLAMACPLAGYQIRKDRTGVIDIMLCVDVSGSMRQTDFVMDGEARDRLYVTKQAVRNFIDSRRERQTGRFGLDRVGLVLFSGIAWTQCPLTLDYDILEKAVEDAQIAPENKQGTAIGSALGLAVRRLSQTEAKSKVIVLLSDGRNNRGELDPLTAAQLAKEYGIRVYTIGAGSPEPTTIQNGLFPVQSEAIDEDMLKKMAGTTGGRYYLATDTAALMNAYGEINELETTEIDLGDYYEFKEGFMPYLVVGSLLTLVSVLVRRTSFEVVP